MKSIITLCLTFAFAFSSSPSGASVFNSDEIEKALSDFFSIYRVSSKGADHLLTDTDKMEIAGALADQVSILPTPVYNDIVGHLLAQYRHHASDRKAIEVFSTKIKERIAHQLRAEQDRGPLLVVLDDVFVAWSAAYFFGFGKGLWQSRGTGLKGIPRFREVAMNVSKNLKMGAKTKLSLTAAGSSAGIAHALYLHLEEKKLDPNRMISSLQENLILEFAKQAVQIRSELRAFKGEIQPDTTLSVFEKSIDSFEIQMNGIQAEMEHFYEVVPNLRNKMQPLAIDLKENQQRIERIKLWIGKQMAGEKPN